MVNIRLKEIVRSWQTNAQYLFSNANTFKLDIPFSSGRNAIITKCYYNPTTNSIVVYGNDITATAKPPLYDPFAGLADKEPHELLK